MRLTLPSLPRPRQPSPPSEPPELPGELRQPARRLMLSRRHKASAGLVAAGAAVVLACFGVGWGTNADQRSLGRGSGALGISGTAADKATGDRAAAARAREDEAAAQRAAEDRAAAAKVLAAKAADARAAAARAAEAKAAEQQRADREIVAMPALVGLGPAGALDAAERAGLTGVTVCGTPEHDIASRSSDWRVTAQDVAAGTRISADRRICLSATEIPADHSIRDAVR
ncbi:PASTA domain-containing protein [Actinoplanes auranticolor]|uniref:PASTA domain-containing protein n=1 Tax=Actinoplanes auranticolor TaxID=47988 RepID=A0A919SWB0_9ACTN|nr:PASTA domain-containing protein [Actinoplanes auranticolor]GIM79672.1 hypothetical protein Aau02nite_86870 [Actinoplanes auranticolor]